MIVSTSLSTTRHLPSRQSGAVTTPLGKIPTTAQGQRSQTAFEDDQAYTTTYFDPEPEPEKKLNRAVQKSYGVASARRRAGKIAVDQNGSPIGVSPSLRLSRKLGSLIDCYV